MERVAWARVKVSDLVNADNADQSTIDAVLIAVVEDVVLFVTHHAHHGHAHSFASVVVSCGMDRRWIT